MRLFHSGRPELSSHTAQRKIVLDKLASLMYNYKKQSILKGGWYKMTTEEMLLQLVEGQKQLFEGQKQTNERLDKMDKRLDRMDERLDKLEKDVRIIKLTLENDISPSIKMLSEFQLENSKRLIKLENDVTELKDELAINDVLQGLKENNLM